MSYIGKVELKASDIKRDSGTISGTPSTVTLNFTAANSNSLLFYLNGVKQSTSLYTIGSSPTVITLVAGTFTVADEWEAIGINDVGTLIAPADGSVTLPKLSSGTGSAGQFLKTDGVSALSWGSGGTTGDITTANNFFQNWNTIDVNTTSTFATTINAAIIGPISVTGSYVWSVNGTLNIL
tara:strand:+ start:354 stop:896 length:543 start_codon:yes stop_codon:yes gene_type:complete